MTLMSAMTGIGGGHRDPSGRRPLKGIFFVTLPYLDKAPHLSISNEYCYLDLVIPICQLNQFHTNSEAAMLSTFTFSFLEPKALCHYIMYSNSMQ